MLILAFSDSHGNPDRMLRAIEHAKPDMVLHLGDGGRDIDKIKSQFPELPLTAVRGNCDISGSLPEQKTLTINGVKLFLTHGHLFGVKQTHAMLIGEAAAMGANAVLFGHTHEPVDYTAQGLYVINPGTAGFPPRQTYAELVITDSGELFSRIIRL